MTTSTTEFVPVVSRADRVPGPAQGFWTYDAYEALPNDGNRYEIIGGVLFMTPAPNIAHQNAVAWFTVQQFFA